MKRLPNRYINVQLPISTMRVACGQLAPSEDFALFWLWDWPRLVGWPRNINWLWSSIDARKSAAALTGIDSIASLIRVEIRTDRGDEPDPFEKLVFEVKDGSLNRNSTAESLREKWRKCCSRDAGFAQIGWRRNVDRLLELRSDLGNPPPVLVGVVASTRYGFRLSPKTLRNFATLQRHVGHERVLSRVISATLGLGGLRVQCRDLVNDRVGE